MNEIKYRKPHRTSSYFGSDYYDVEGSGWEYGTNGQQSEILHAMIDADISEGTIDTMRNVLDYNGYVPTTTSALYAKNVPRKDTKYRRMEKGNNG